MLFDISGLHQISYDIGLTLIGGFGAFASLSIGKNIYTRFRSDERKYEYPVVQMYEASDEKKCESPIEVQMYKALSKQGIKAIPQYPVDRCRIDLAVIQNGKKIGVECDGADYHSTPEQIEYDQRRDAFLESRGWHMVRFTGSKIYNDADGCAEYVKRLISGQEKSSA